MKVTETPIGQVIPYARNPRKNDAAVVKVAASIHEYGFRQPIVVDENMIIIAGHTRLLASQHLGLKKVPVHIATGLTPAQIKAYRIMDNRSSQDAEWDVDLLKLEFGDLLDDDFDMSLTGFGEDELDGIMADITKDGLTDEDDVPDPPDEPVTKLGDLWALGNHRIICGDSTDPLVVERLLGGVEPHLMVTDPPYGVEYDPDWRNKATRADGTPIGASAIGVVQNDDTADWSEAWALFPGDVAYVWCAPGPLQCVVHDTLVVTGFEPRQQIVWAKGFFAIGRGHYHYQHENCWYAVKKGKTGHWAGDRKQTTLWEIPKPHKSETGHSTQKPVECMRRPIENNSNPGQAVYEPFSGSGTTIIAAETTGRVCYAIELNPAYVDIAVKRWEEFTGKKAELLGAMDDAIEDA